MMMGLLRDHHAIGLASYIHEETKNVNDNSGNNPDNGSSISHFKVIYILFAVVLGLVAVLLFIVFCLKKTRKPSESFQKQKQQEDSIEKALDHEIKDHEDHQDDDEMGEDTDQEKRYPIKYNMKGKRKVVSGSEENSGKLIFTDEAAAGLFQHHDLLKAPAEGLGKGIFGNTYKARLETGGGSRIAVVVKRLRDLKPLSNEEFTKQLLVIAHLKHPNLLPILGYYYSKEEKLLIYKYAENGNLFQRIHGSRRSSSSSSSNKRERIPFRWSSRLSVARGVARALEYLHINSSNNKAIIPPHGNLKSSNILLDEKEMVLVSDYGFSSLLALPIASQRMVSYRSPEYQSSKKISRKSDVWSYGCLLLELLTGRVSVHSAPPGINGVDLSSWVLRAVKEEWTAEIFDPEISMQRSGAHGMLKLLQIAIQCCNKWPDKRPEMSEVAREVESIKVAESSEEEEESSFDHSSLTDASASGSATAMVSEEMSRY